MSLIELQSHHFKLALQSDKGLQSVRCQIFHRQEWVDLMPDCLATNAHLTASNFHLVPYSNRVRDGKFSFEQQSYVLQDAARHAIHGALRNKPWRTLEVSARHVVAEYDTRKDGEVNWPWPMQCQASYALNENELIGQLQLTNHGNSNMPAGLGWHPYFCRYVNGAEPTLELPVSGVYPDSGGDCLPIGAPVNMHSAVDFRSPRRLDETTRIDHCFSGFESPARLAWPNAGVSIELSASENCTHLILFNPDKPYFAVEPVTNANDAFNLESQGVEAGVTVLAPEQTLHATMKIALSAFDS